MSAERLVVSSSNSSHDPWSLINDGPLTESIRTHLEAAPAPNLVEFYVSDRCALRCKYCFHGDVHSKSAGLDYGEWQQAIEQFVELGTRRLHFAGREPFLSPDFIPLVRWLGSRRERSKLCVGAISDGFSCAPLIPQLRDAPLDYLDISIDGVRADHDRLRGRGTYDRALRAIELLITSLPELCVSVASVLSPDNAPNVIRFIDELRQHGVRRFYFQPVQPLGSARNMTQLTPADLRRTVLQLRDELALGRFAGCGLSVMMFVPVEYLPEVASGDQWMEARVTDSLYRGRSSFELSGNRFITDFEIARVPFNNHVIVSHDGYLLARFGFRSVPDYDFASPGNLRSASARDLLAKARAMTLSSMTLDSAPFAYDGALHILQ